MKNTFLTLAIASMLLISCGEDDTADIIINNTDNSINNNTTGSTTDPNAGEVINISGTYVQDLTLEAKNQYTLNGALVMAEGTNLYLRRGSSMFRNSPYFAILFQRIISSK